MVCVCTFTTLLLMRFDLVQVGEGKCGVGVVVRARDEQSHETKSGKLYRPNMECGMA